jgi:hypothetical protein
MKVKKFFLGQTSRTSCANASVVVTAISFGDAQVGLPRRQVNAFHSRQTTM